MTSNHGRRIQIRRALAILTWLTMVVVAGLLWYGQRERIIRTQAWEPASLLLSAYATFLSIFGWLLFSPGRKSAEESPGLFFSGILTLLPPCFIAYHLMPIGSPLRPWLTIGVFLFGVLAIMSPLPDEVFAVPRHRRSYLQPLTDAYLSELNVGEPQVSFENLVPRTAFWLSRPAMEPETSSAGATRDPWADPFYGTGRQMSRIGVSQSRRSAERSREDRRPVSDEQFSFIPDPPTRETQPARENPSGQAMVAPEPPPLRRQTEPMVTESLSENFSSSIRRSDSAVNPPIIQKITEPRRPDDSAISPSAPSTPISRRPITEPSQRSSTAVGFQTPPQTARPLTQSPPPLPASAFPTTGSWSAGTLPASSVPGSPPTPQARPASVPPLREPVIAAASSMAVSSLTSPPPPPTTAVAPGSTLRQLDQQIRAMEADDEREPAVDSETEEPNFGTGPLNPAAGVTRSVQQTSSDVRLERIRDEHGGEMIEGTIQVFFDIGQKRAHLHVPFSPPLPGLPEVECEPVGEDLIRVKVAVRQPYGIRLEARRSEASEALKAEVSFAAVYTPSSRRG